MKIEFNGHLLVMEDTIQELPITRFQMYNLNTMIDAGIGDDLSSFDERCANVRRLMRTDVEAADREVMNLQTNLRFIMSSTSPKMRSFCALIRSIDGRPVTDDDLTEDGVTALIAELGKKRLKIDQVKNFLRLTKKKIDNEFDVFFPQLNDSAVLKEYYSQLKRRTLLVIEWIKNQTNEVEEQIATIDDFLMSQFKPKNYHGANGLEAKMIRGFEETCVILSQNQVSSAPKKMTAIAFYQALELLKQQLKQRNKKK